MVKSCIGGERVHVFVLVYVEYLSQSRVSLSCKGLMHALVERP